MNNEKFVLAYTIKFCELCDAKLIPMSDYYMYKDMYAESKCFEKTNSNAFLIIDILTFINKIEPKIKIPNTTILILIMSMEELGIIK